MRTRRIAIVTVVGAVAAVLTLTVVPFPQRYQSTQAPVGIGANFGCGVVDTTPGTPIVFSWQTPTNTTFYAWHCTVDHSGDATSFHWTAVYTANGTSGGGRLTSGGGWYLFGTVCPGVPSKCVSNTVTVNYYGPLIDLWTPSG